MAVLNPPYESVGLRVAAAADESEIVHRLINNNAFIRTLFRSLIIRCIFMASVLGLKRCTSAGLAELPALRVVGVSGDATGFGDR